MQLRRILLYFCGAIIAAIVLYYVALIILVMMCAPNDCPIEFKLYQCQLQALLQFDLGL